MYDCAGASIFNQVEMNSQYYESAAAVAIVFDIGNRESLLSARKWYTAVKTASDSGNKLFGVLIGNKADYRTADTVDNRCEIQYEDGQQMAKELGLAYFETSAMQNNGVEEPFKYIATEFNKMYAHTVGQADEMVGSDY
jgi:GTPase SAR1 family protein